MRDGVEQPAHLRQFVAVFVIDFSRDYRELLRYGFSHRSGVFSGVFANSPLKTLTPVFLFPSQIANLCISG